jgi:hypothetical protein
MFNLSELVRGGTLCLSKAGLAIGGTTSKARTNAPNGAGIDYAIGGKLYHIADSDDNITFTAKTVTALYSCCFTICAATGGTFSTVAGDLVLTADVTAGKPLPVPEPTAGTCPIGYIRIDAGASVFTAGTTALTGGTVTVTYVDCFALPDAVIVS